MKRIKKSIKLKSLIWIEFLLAVFTLIMCITGFILFTDALLEQYSEGAFRTADTAADLFTKEELDDYLEDGEKADTYARTLDDLQWLCNSSQSTFIYIIQPDVSDYGHIHFIFSVINKNMDYPLYPTGYVKETTNDEYREKYRNLYEGKSRRELVIRDKGFIETDPHITAMVPLLNSSNEVDAILCVQWQMDAMNHARRTYIHILIFIMVLLAVLVGCLLCWRLNHTLIDPVKQVTAEAARFAAESITTGSRLTDTIHNSDEIGLLAESVDRMEEQIVHYVENLTRITAEKEHIATEMSLAAKIQANMLPDQFPAFPWRREFDIYGTMDPAKDVGGDFFDFFLVDQDHLCIVIADVSGKGVPAALYMMASMIILKDNCKAVRSPAEILSDVNTLICSHTNEGMFLTIWLGILEISTGKLKAANAGHEYPVFRNPGGRFEIFRDKHGFVLGGMDGIIYKEYELTLEPGAKLFLYTDGVPEAVDRSEKMFGMERLVNALNEYAEESPKEILLGVKKSVEGFVQDADQFDDLTMVCLSYLGPGER